MSVFSNKQIESAIADGHIVCTPYNPKHVGQASLDFTLGKWFYKTEKLNERTTYNPYDREDVERYFDGPYQALSHKQWCDLNGLKLFKGIPSDQPIIVLHPQERILGHTHEFIGIRPPGCAVVHSRSSMGRNGIAIAFDAGFIDPGYINRITLEIYNLNKTESIVLPVGERVGQLIFHDTGDVEGDYGLGRHGGMSGKYQTGTDLDTIIRTWTPDQMLPKSYLDERAKPKKIPELDDE